MNLFNNRPSLGRKLHLDCFSDLGRMGTENLLFRFK